MEKLQSKLTSQGQVSVPAAVRRLLQLVPGSMLAWSQEGDRVVVERVRRYRTADVHQALFSQGPVPAPKTQAELKEGVRQQMRRRHARG